MHVPSWICIPVALGAFVFIQIVIGIAATSAPGFDALRAFGPLLGGGTAALILLIGFKAMLAKNERRRLLAKQTGIDSIRELSWPAFELLIGEAYRQRGYAVSETGQGGADGGIDLLLRRNGTSTIVQCKQWKVWKVGVKPVRELYGVMVSERADRAVFVTSGEYTADAVAFARGKAMELIGGAELERMISPARNVAPMPPIRPVLPSLTSTPAAPACSRCGSEMVLRTAKRGAQAGAQFWGCKTYPKCKATREAALVC